MSDLIGRAAALVDQRQLIVMLNDPLYDYIELTSGGLGHSSLTLIREGAVLYCIFSWPNAKPGVQLVDGAVQLNAGLLAEYTHAGSQFQISISEYMMFSHMADAKPDTVVYTGAGWGGAIATLMAAVVPPDHIFAFEEPLIWHKSVLTYLHEKTQGKVKL